MLLRVFAFDGNAAVVSEGHKAAFFAVSGHLLWDDDKVAWSRCVVNV